MEQNVAGSTHTFTTCNLFRRIQPQYLFSLARSHAIVAWRTILITSVGKTATCLSHGRLSSPNKNIVFSGRRNYTPPAVAVLTESLNPNGRSMLACSHHTQCVRRYHASRPGTLKASDTIFEYDLYISAAVLMNYFWFLLPLAGDGWRAGNEACTSTDASPDTS